MKGPERNRVRRDRDRSKAARRREKRARVRTLAFESLEIRRVLTADYLQLTFDQENIAENAGDGAVDATLSRTHQFADYAAPLEVTLHFSDISELTGVDSITIPAGQQSISFELNPVDDALLDGDQSVYVTAASDGYLSSTTEFVVKDHETLTFHVASTVREDGQSLAFEIERSDTSSLETQSLTIQSNNPALSAPTLVLPTGVARASFSLDVNDDNLLNGDRLVSLVAASAGFASADAQVTVSDYETLSLSLNRQIMSESGGSLSAVLTRSVGAADSALEVTLSLNDGSEASAPSTVSIPAGASQVAFQLDAVDDNLLDGTQSVQLLATASGFESTGANFDVLDSEALTLELSATSVNEHDSSTKLLATVSRPLGQDQSTLLVALRSSDTSRIRVPNTVTIPVGMDTALFYVEPQDDHLLSGPSDVEIRAFALDYVPTEASVLVEDYETLSLSIDREHLRETDNGVLTVTRNNINTESPLTVSLTASPSGELNLPASVTIPSGVSSIEVVLSPVDDNVIEDPVTVGIEAEASGYVSAIATVDVVDVERLRLSPSVEIVAEDAGPESVELTLIRFNEDITTDLIIQLQSTDTSEIQTPTQVTIPAGQRSVAAKLDVIDDTLLDGAQSVEIIATAAGYVDSSFTILVNDAEALTLQILNLSVMESDGVGAATAILRRSNTDLADPLRVAILNSDASELQIPSIVEIPAGSQEVSFSIDAIDDQVVDGDQIVTLTAVASGYQESEDQLKVIDFAGFASWTNPNNAMDVDDSSTVNVRDALVLVYELRTRGPQALPQPTPGFRPPPWLDTNGDGNFNTLDVFLVIEYINNHLSTTRNAAEGEGEAQQHGSALPAQTSILAAAIIDVPPVAMSTAFVSPAIRQSEDVINNSVGGDEVFGLPSESPNAPYRDLAIAATDTHDDEQIGSIIDDIADDVDDVFHGPLDES